MLKNVEQQRMKIREIQFHQMMVHKKYFIIYFNLYKSNYEQKQRNMEYNLFCFMLIFFYKFDFYNTKIKLSLACPFTKLFNEYLISMDQDTKLLELIINTSDF